MPGARSHQIGRGRGHRVSTCGNGSKPNPNPERETLACVCQYTILPVPFSSLISFAATGSQVHQAPSSPANPKPIASAFSIPVVCFPDLSPIQGTLTRCYWLFVSQCRPSSAFAAFAGTSSSLASASIATNGLQRPIWCGESAERTDGTSIPVRPGVNPTGNVADNAEGLSEPTKSSGSNEPSLNSVENPLAALAASATANPQQSMFWIHPTSGRRF